MKFKGYRFGIQWIAHNDEPTEYDPEIVSGMISVLLLADLCNKNPEEVAKDVIRYRNRHNIYGGG